MGTIVRDQPRSVKITPNINPYAHGSALVEFGNTKVHITAMVEESVPPWMKGKGTGWVTAEYAMLPGSSDQRIRRERKGISGRGHEIQRLIGRCLRSIVDLDALGETSIIVDCDVLVADGGTRTASISGAYVALCLAINKLIKEGRLSKNPIKEPVAALSVGITAENKIIADLNYQEDSSCGTDMNIVMTQSGKFVEVQGTAEGEPFSHEMLLELLSCAKTALVPVFKAQTEAISHA